MITVCGEALVDLVSQDSRHFIAYPGGSPANVAVGLARLGLPVSLLARISTDSFGRLLRAHLTANGVDPRDFVEAGEPTTLAVATVDSDGSARYDFYVEGTADWQWAAAELPERLPDDVTAVHTGSMVLEVAPGAQRVLALLEREHDRAAVTVSYDPNIRLARRGDRATALARIERVVALADVVKVSAEDLAWVLPGTSPEAVARAWATLGPALVVVTLGAQGAVAVRGTVRVDIGAPSLAVVDTVGAGDAFTSGLLSALDEQGVLGGPGRGRLSTMDEHDISAALRRATAVAALTCSRPGADPPTKDDLDALERLP